MGSGAGSSPAGAPCEGRGGCELGMGLTPAGGRGPAPGAAVAAVAGAAQRVLSHQLQPRLAPVGCDGAQHETLRAVPAVLPVGDGWRRGTGNHCGGKRRELRRGPLGCSSQQTLLLPGTSDAPGGSLLVAAAVPCRDADLTSLTEINQKFSISGLEYLGFPVKHWTTSLTLTSWKRTPDSSVSL